MKSFTKHLPHYLVLFGILLAGFAGLILFSYDKNFQTSIAAATAAGYVTWGITHHLLHRDFHWEVLVEYASIAMLGFVIIFSMIIRT